MSLKSVQKYLTSHKNEINLPPNGATVFVGISGGVDSSVVAMLLKSMGYGVRGVFLVCWDPEYPGCTSNEDKKNAIKISSLLNIPLRIIDFRDEYKSKVMTYLWDEYKIGRVPNPDIVCNREIKFGLLKEWVKRQDKNVWLSTGHYARIARNQIVKVKTDKSAGDVKNIQVLCYDDLTNQTKESNDKSFKKLLVKDKLSIASSYDKSKDQSYFLSNIDEEILNNTTFPLGVLKKNEVRELAKEFNMPSWNKEDSQGICFIGDVNMTDFIKENVKLITGDIIDKSLEVIGEHKGLALYTLGQRHGLQVKKYVSEPMYVIDKDIKKNLLIVGNRNDAFCDEFTVDICNMNSLFECLLFAKLSHNYKDDIDIEAKMCMDDKVNVGDEIDPDIESVVYLNDCICDSNSICACRTCIDNGNENENENGDGDRDRDRDRDSNGHGDGKENGGGDGNGNGNGNENGDGNDNDNDNDNDNGNGNGNGNEIAIDDEFFGHGKKLTVRIRNLGSFLPCQLKIPFHVKNKHKTSQITEVQGTYKKQKTHTNQEKNNEYENYDLIPDYSYSSKNIKVKLTSSEFGINPGQYAVFYLDDTIIMSGSINKVNTGYKKRFLY